MSGPTRYSCGDQRRREAVRATGIGNGIDYLEVVDGPGIPLADRQRLLRIHFLNPPSAELLAITADQITVSGGVRVRGIDVLPPLFDGAVLVVRVDRPGDFSGYTLTLGEPGGAPVADLDALLSTVDFSFKIECPSHFDCAGECGCSADSRHADQVDEPEIDYLALDDASLRRLMLDRLAVTVPGWTERNPADLGVALVELLAYAGDHLAYQLDATATEATLATARRRTSVRRHARFVDYRVDDGANARAWVQIRLAAGAGAVTLPAGTQLLSQVPGVPRVLVDPSPDYTRALAAGPVVFETMEERTFRDTLNELALYAWGDRDCCLPAGATSASLQGRHDDLRAGDVVLFEERLGPRSGEAADANPAHRHAVRLTADPVVTSDPLGSWFTDPTQPLTGVEVTEIAWGADDALPFPLCVSATTEDGAFLPAVSILLGNLVLADHGRSVVQVLPRVPDADPRLNQPARYGPTLGEPDVTRVGTLGRALPGGDPRQPAGFDPAASARSAFGWQDRHVLPDAWLTDQHTGERWLPRRDLLGSDGFAAEFVAESENDGSTTLRFGDGRYGMPPRAGAQLEAHYRTGGGTVGNIGADALWHVVTAVGGIAAVTNPLPAGGGRDPEPQAGVRQHAPVAFRTPERAVTAEDYAAMALRHPGVQQTVGTERWTGSWHTIFLTVDRRGGLPIDEAFEADLRTHLERYRMAGHDLEIVPPRQIALELALRVCVLPNYFRTDVEQRLKLVLGTGRLTDGTTGLFHPDNLTFGTSIYLSAVLAAVQAVEGVHYVEPLVFGRLGLPASSGIETGVLSFSALEIPRLDNDPSFADRGTLTLQMEGGR